MVNKNSTFSLTVNSLSSGRQEVRTEFQPKGTGEYFYVANTAVGLGYALELSDQFAFGIKLKYINEQLAQYQNHKKQQETKTKPIGTNTYCIVANKQKRIQIQNNYEYYYENTT